jgi:hypothetical protein
MDPTCLDPTAVKRLGTLDGMDDKLLAEARQAQERLIDAERGADVARAEFHRAVPCLHLHGASLRDIAAARRRPSAGWWRLIWCREIM